MNPDDFILKGRDGNDIKPIGFRKTKPICSHANIPSMEDRYANNFAPRSEHDAPVPATTPQGYPSESPSPKPMEIYRIPADLHTARQRFCLVVDNPANGCVNVLHISNQFDKFDPKTDFHISAEHPDFAATGLEGDAFILPRTISEPLEKFKSTKQRPYRMIQ